MCCRPFPKDRKNGKIARRIGGARSSHIERSAFFDRQRIIGETARQPPDIAGVSVAWGSSLLFDMWENPLLRAGAPTIPRKVQETELRREDISVIVTLYVNRPDSHFEVVCLGGLFIVVGHIDASFSWEVFGRVGYYCRFGLRDRG